MLTNTPTWFPMGADGYVCVMAFLVAAAVTVVSVLPARSIAKRLGAVDQPGGRRVHRKPTARLGGLAVLAGLLVGCGIALGSDVMPYGAFAERWNTVLPILAIAVGVCALGAIDDVRALSPRNKMGGLGVAAVLLVFAGIRIDVIDVPGIGTFELGYLAIPLTIFWVLACTNAVNLIDGVDGASSGVAMVSAFVLALVSLGVGDPVSAVLFAALGGACAGFLVHNRHPATIFLGDSGSLLLGFVLAANSAAGCTKQATALSLTAALLALAVPFLDTTQSFLRRFRSALQASPDRRKGIAAALKATAVADHGHIHHRLLFRGMNHAQVSRVLCLVTLAIGMSTLLMLPSERPTLRVLVGAQLAGAFMLARLAALRAPTEAAPRTETPVILQPAQPRVFTPPKPVAPAAKRTEPVEAERVPVETITE